MQQAIIIGGSLTLRLTSGVIPLAATSVAVTPDSPSQTPPAWLREPHPLYAVQRSLGRLGESACVRITDRDGRVRYSNVPPGPARARVRRGNSSWIRRLNVPADGTELVLQVPPGVLPVRVVDADTRAPIGGA